MNTEETIVALSTPSGSGAIGVIRISGNKAFEVIDKIFISKHSNKRISNQKSHTIHLGNITDNETVVDEVLVSIFRAPNSYTGENVIEISCHGSRFIQQKIMDLILQNGVQMAKPGEFTLRAYLNAKMDLSQAEAVADLIASESKAEHEIAMNQMRGSFSLEIKELREKLINFAALIELELDFSEEDVEFANRKEFLELINKLEEVIKKLVDSFAYGNVIKNGVPVVIAGKPNAGKSSLLNALVGENRAIVSDIEGTTRDSIEDEVNIEGIRFRFIDTAGLRKTTDTIESIGIERTLDQIEKAKILIYLFDLAQSSSTEVIESIKKYHREDLKIILCQTHIDLNGNKFENEYLEISKSLLSEGEKYFEAMFGLALKGNALSPTLELLKINLVEAVSSLNEGNTVVSSSRHRQALENTLKSLSAVKNGLNSGISGDLLALDTRDSLRYLGEITGEIDMDEDILGTIFGKFCIGK